MRSSLPAATVARLPVYLRCLRAIGSATCSSEELANMAGVNPAQVRKDLSYLGSQGTRGVGYDVAQLTAQIRHALGLDHRYPVVIVGAGNLGAALTNYGGFNAQGFEVAAVVDADPAKVGRAIDGLVVEPIERLADIVAERGITIGIIATPAEAAQDVADRLTAAGVRSILNFAPAVLQVPSDVEVRRVDLSTELQILAFHLSGREAKAADASGA